MGNPIFSLLITTKNRKHDLAFTLSKIKYLLDREDVVCIICDDGSTDGTTHFLQTNHPEIQLIQNPESRGLIFSRNRLLSLVTTEFAISLDDDAHFLTEDIFAIVQKYFESNTACGLLALRIFWGLEKPALTFTNHKPERVQGFVGCAHVWRMISWHSVPDYPDWFVFYGEEDFAAFQLLKKNWEIHYFPDILVHHRVNLKARRQHKDYIERQRRSLRSGWYLLFLFYPISKIPREFIYSIWIQFKTKVFTGDFKAFEAILLALLDLVWNMPRILRNSNRLSSKEFEIYTKLPATRLYWQPET